MKLAAVFAGLLLFTAALRAQTPVYKISFAVHEIEDGKRVGTRNYTMMVESDSKGTIRAGTKVPVKTSADQFQYIDTGVNLDCRVREREGGLTLYADFELSGPPTEGEQKAFTGGMPPIHQMRSTVAAAAVAGKPLTILTIDDPATRRRYELEVTATKVR